MNYKVLIISAVFLLAAGSSSVMAQTKSCPLDLNVIKYRPIDSEAPDIPISGATAAATYIATRKTTKAASFEGMPRFAGLREGKYTVSVTKKGYKRTVKQVTINCNGLDDDGSVNELIFLQKGSAKQTFNMPPTETAIETRVDDSTPTETLYTAPPTPKPIIGGGGVVNGKAVNLIAPAYPAAARAVKAAGAVNVQVTIDEQGNVISAAAISGHPLLRQAAEKAARDSKFRPTLLSGEPVKVTGVIVYNFVP